MRTFKLTLAALAVVAFAGTAPIANAHEPVHAVGDAVGAVGCAVVTVVTLPIAILTGGPAGC